MKIKELFEGAEPNLPGAEPGIQIMSMDQFLRYGSDGKPGGVEPAEMDEPDEEEEEEPKGVGREKRTDEDLTRRTFIKGAAGAAVTGAAGQAGAGLLTSPKEQQFQDQIKDPADKERYLKARRNWIATLGTPTTNQFFTVRFRAVRREMKAKYHILDEATKMSAPQRPLKDKELTDYMDRIRGTPKLDKKGNKTFYKDKVSKKGVVTPGAEKYDSGKTKVDKFKMPYIHRSSVIEFYNETGKQYNVDAIKKALGQRPKKLLKQNEKMKHSNGAYEQFFNIGFAALTGIALDENTNELIVVNTCPGAGSCKVDCFAMKGGKVQFAGPWLSDGKILTYLLNDPAGFSMQLKGEIRKEAAEGKAGSKGFEAGWNVTVRWHDAGDFFSPEYMDLAFDVAREFPEVKFYAYTKIADAALGDKPDNFIINWSEGANTTQEKQVKAQDPELEHTKNSRIVPEKLFYDLLKKDAKGNLDKEGADAKGGGGRWVTRDSAATGELKHRLAKAYGLSPSSILSYDEYMARRNSIPTGMKYNVIVAPGEGDVSANDHGVLSTLLLRH